MYENIQTQPRPLWNFPRLLAWHLTPAARWSSARRHGFHGSHVSHGSHGPCGPWCRFFWNLLGTQAMWSKQTFWRPVRSILTGHLVYPRFWWILLLKNIQPADKKEAGELEEAICSGKSPYFWIKLKPHGVVLRKSRLRYQPLCSHFPSWPAASTPTLRHDALLQPSFGVTGLQSWLQGFCGSLHGF